MVRFVLAFVIVVATCWAAALAACIGVVAWANQRARRSR
jgi:hypothetical protein